MNIPREKLEQWRSALQSAAQHDVSECVDALSSIEAELEQPQQPVHLTNALAEASTVQLPSRMKRIEPSIEAASTQVEEATGKIRNLAAHGLMYLREKQYGFAEKALEEIIDLATDGGAVEAEPERHGSNKTEPASAPSQPQGEQSTDHPKAIADCDAALLKVHDHLGLALRIPTMPWPDPGAHGHEATARAIHASYCAIRFAIMDAIASLTAGRVALAAAQPTAPESPQAAAQSTSEWVDANVSGNPALVQAMKNHAEAAQSTAQWVMVPREPDDDMVDAACEAGNLFRVDFTRAWEASIAAAPSAQSTALEPVACKRCNGTGVVDDGESDCSDGGIPYENGPIKCVKDCPVCRGASALATPSAAMALLGEARAELADLMEVAERCDSWQSFPNAPLEKARAFIARIDALTGTGRKEQSNG